MRSRCVSGDCRSLPPIAELVRRGPDLWGPAGVLLPETVPDDLTISFWDPVDELFHEQRFVGRRLSTWTVGEAPPSSTPISLGHEEDDVVRLLACRTCRVDLGGFRVLAHEGRVLSPPPPLDDRTRHALQAVPRLSGAASSAVELTLLGSPFDQAMVILRLEAGRPTIEVARDPKDRLDETAAVRASLDIGRVLRYMAGDIELMAMLEGGQVDGDWAQLMFVAGVIESPEFQEAIEDARPRYLHLADALSIIDSRSYRRALDTLGEGG